MFLRVGLEITDGIIKNLFSTGLEKPLLFKKSFFYSEDVAVGSAVRGVVSGNAMLASGDLRNEQNDKGNDPPVLDVPPSEDAPAVEPLREFLVRHRGRMSRGGGEGNDFPGAPPIGSDAEISGGVLGFYEFSIMGEQHGLVVSALQCRLRGVPGAGKAI